MNASVNKKILKESSVLLVGQLVVIFILLVVPMKVWKQKCLYIQMVSPCRFEFLSTADPSSEGTVCPYTNTKWMTDIFKLIKMED